MKLSELLNKDIEQDVEIKGIQTDSRLIQSGDLFIAYVGEVQDGRQYIEQAIGKGAAAVSYEICDLPAYSIPCIPISNLKEKLGSIVAKFYHYPSKHLQVIGVTGTNGKTSVVHFLAQAFSLLGFKCGVLSTIGNGIYPDLKETQNTTAGAIEIQKNLAAFCQAGCDYVAMEVSSHGLEQHRVDGIEFETAVFTNLSRDHLDYHGSMENYAAAKEKFFQFPNLKNAVINAEDEFGKILIEKYSDKLNVIQTGYDLSVRFDFSKNPHLIGKFNLSNLLAVANVLNLYKIPVEKITSILSQLKPPPGRMQTLGGNGKPLVVIDYAHTPDALKKALQALKENCGGKLWCLFGCGGDRDKGKRPMMAQVVEKYANYIVVTDDNPRTESPYQIIQQICEGFVSQEKIHVEPDRAKAIQYAISNASPDDIVLIAGKGHEDYQTIGKERHPFSDVEEVKNSLQKIIS